jgi:hypothetical protein
MKSIEWLRLELEKIYVPYPEEAFVEWWIENDKLPERYKEHPYKVCSICKEELHITKYNIRRGRSKRYGELNCSSLCFDCSKLKSRRERGVEETGELYHGESPIGPKRKVFDGNAETRGKTIKLALMEYFGGCVRCGYQGQPPQMDLDHLNPKEKLISLGSSTLPHKTIEEIITEVQKCQMLCSNCHRLVSTKYEHHIKDHITYHPMNDRILHAMSSAEKDREFLRKDSS